jgi:hypothetical protein
MKNTPAFIIYGPNLGLPEDSPEELRAEVYAVVSKLAKHGSDEVAECFEDESFANTLTPIFSDNRAIMGSKTYCTMMPVFPFDTFPNAYHQLLVAPGCEAVMVDEDSESMLTQIKCWRCGALCQGPVDAERGCEMCEDDEEEDPYHECDCEVSGGSGRYTNCAIHMALRYALRGDDMKVWPLSYEPALVETKE